MFNTPVSSEYRGYAIDTGGACDIPRAHMQYPSGYAVSPILFVSVTGGDVI